MVTTNKTQAGIDPKAKEAIASKVTPPVKKVQEKPEEKVEAKPAGKPTLAQLVKSNQRRTQKLAIEKEKRNK